jgi:hypothetical protein
VEATGGRPPGATRSTQCRQPESIVPHPVIKAPNIAALRRVSGSGGAAPRGQVAETTLTAHLCTKTPSRRVGTKDRYGVSRDKTPDGQPQSAWEPPPSPLACSLQRERRCLCWAVHFDPAPSTMRRAPASPGRDQRKMMRGAPSIHDAVFLDDSDLVRLVRRFVVHDARHSSCLPIGAACYVVRRSTV